MDQPARDTLSAIDRILADLAEDEIGADEFTVKDVQAASPNLTMDGVANRLVRKEQRGELTSRLVFLNGRRVRVYRYKD